MSGALYIPGNDRLLDVLDGLPGRLRRYRDHAALLLHFVAVRSWQRRPIDADLYTRLHSRILRQYIPDRLLRPLRDHLEAEGVLVCDGYSAGRHSIGYRVSPDFDGLPGRWVLSDARLLRKLQAWRQSTVKEDGPEMQALACRRKPVTDAMLDALNNLRLNVSPDYVEQALRGRGIDTAHVRYACGVIANGDHDGVCMDPFGWRVHSIVTHTAAAMRPFLSFDSGSLVELDVCNAQPLILAAALRNPALCATYVGNAQHNGEMGERGGDVRGRLLGLLRSVPVPELDEFARLCETGCFYEALLVDGNREKTKRAVYRDVFFGKPQQHGPVSDTFKGLWPHIYGAVQGLKRLYGYKIVAQLLQRMESTIMIDGACGGIVTELPGIRFLTIHDAALVVAGQAEQVCGIIEGQFRRYGVMATVRQKNLSERKAVLAT